MTISQDLFAQALLAPNMPVPPGLVDPKGRQAGKRFDVYRNNVVSSLTAALETAFPVIRKLVGESNFKVLAQAYLHQHPPSTPLMMYYGGEMPGFLAEFAPARAIGYLPDVARLECAIRKAYHAADASPIDAARFNALSPDRLAEARLDISPALQIIRSPWPILSIWLYNVEPGSPKPEQESQDVAVIRRRFDPEPLLLPPGAASFVEALQTGESLASSATKAESDSVEFDLAQTLGFLLQNEIITDLKEQP